LRDFVEATPELDLAALTLSLQIHRDAMDERLSFVAHGIHDVVDVLSAYIDGAGSNKPLPHGVFAAHVRQGRESVRMLSEDAAMAALIVDKCIADGNASKLCELWVKGLALDWRRLHGPHRPTPIALPPYPFSEDAYWVVPNDIVYAAMPARGSDKPRHAHPLLQEKIADIREQGYRQTTAEQDAGADAAKQTERIHLPTYAFARMHCWIPSKDDVHVTSGPVAGAPSLQQPGRFLQNLDAIAGLFLELEEDTLSAAEVTARVKQLA
jgi:acyl transferase domain-containing protein